MKSILKYASSLIVAYLTAWSAAYVFMSVSRGDGLKFSHYFEYLALGWTLRGGELPTFIWIISFGAFLPLAVLVIVVVRRNETTKDTAEPANQELEPLVRVVDLPAFGNSMKAPAKCFLVITPWVLLLCLGVFYLWSHVFSFPWVWQEKGRAFRRVAVQPGYQAASELLGLGWVATGRGSQPALAKL